MYDVEDAARSQPPTSNVGQAAARLGKPLDWSRLLRALFRRKWWLLAAAVLGVGAGVVAAKTVAPRSYEASTTMVWEPDADEGVRDLRTRIDSVTLNTNLAEVRRRLAVPLTLEQLSSRIVVGYDEHSNLVTVTASAGEADEAVVLTDTIVDEFLAHQRELESTRRSEQVEELQRDIERARANLRGAQERYDAFRRERGITDLSSERQRAIEQAANLRAQADMAAAHVEARPTVSAGAPTSPRLEQARRQLTLARSRLSDQHPRVQSLTAEVAVLESELAAESRAKAPSSEALATARRLSAERRREHMEQVAREAEERLSVLTEVEGEASAMLASVQVAESHVLDVESQLARAEDAARDPSAGFRVVAPAQRPELPTTSLRKPVAVTVPVVVLLLAMILVLLRELWGFRAHTANEVAYWGRASVVGATSWPRRETLNELIDEFSEYALDSSGNTLVIGATDAQSEDAKSLAARLKFMVEFGGIDDEDVVYYDPEEGVAVTDARSATERGLSKSTALAAPRARTSLDKDVRLTQDSEGSTDGRVELWQGREAGPALRRAVRRADRVLVVVPSGKLSFRELAELRGRVGRSDLGLAYVVVGLDESLSSLPDRVGDVDGFWLSRR